MNSLSATKHEHTSGCINTYPDCGYPDDVTHTHDGHAHTHPCEPGDGHLHAEDVPSPGNEPAVYGSVCTIDICDNTTDRKGQPCNDCDAGLGVG